MSRLDLMTPLLEGVLSKVTGSPAKALPAPKATPGATPALP